MTLKDLLGLGRKQDPLKQFFKTRFNIRLRNAEIYKQAITHKSFSNKNPEEPHNEKLEFLGDAILGAVFSSYLHQIYPDLDEGMLTKLRSRAVSRQNLNIIAIDLGLDTLVRAEKNLMSQPNNCLPGNALEAIAGAIYLERGYDTTRRIMLRTMLPLIEKHNLIQSDTNYKSRLLEWGQKAGKSIRLETSETKAKAESRRFKSEVMIENRKFPAGYGRKKKYAEQDAALAALMELGEF